MDLVMNLGAHADVILTCYAAVALVLAGLVLWLVADGRDLARQLAALEERGIRRRSAKSGDAEPEINSRT